MRYSLFENFGEQTMVECRRALNDLGVRYKPWQRHAQRAKGHKPLQHASAPKLALLTATVTAPKLAPQLATVTLELAVPLL